MFNLKKLTLDLYSLQAGDSYASDFIRVSPEELIEDGEDKFITITMVLTDSSDSVKVDNKLYSY